MKRNVRWVYLLFIIVMVAYTLMHIGLWSDEPPGVDSVNLTLALDKYDISADKPHAPGYPLYVGLAKVAAYIVGDAYAYQLINLLMILAASACLFLLAKHQGHAEVGLAATVLLITHPLTFSSTIVQESYFSDALFGCLIVTWLFIKSKNFKTQVIGLSLIFFALGLFRIVSCAQLGLLAIACVYFTNRTSPITKVAITILSIVSCALIAYLITIWLAGGYAAHSEATSRVMGTAFAAKSMLAGAPIETHAYMLLKLISWLIFASLPTVLLTAYLLLKNKGKSLIPRAQLILFTCWVLPSLGLFSLIYFHKPVYLMILLPPILLAFSTLTFSIFKNKHGAHAWYLIILIASAQLLFFFTATDFLPNPLYRVSRTYFQKQDATLKELKQIIQKENSVGTLLIWEKNPSFKIYTTRMYAWKGVIARIDSKDRVGIPHPKNGILSITTFNQKNMSFGYGVNLKKINKVLIIDSNHHQPKYQVYNTQQFLNTVLAAPN
ncbi:MAG: hypothetical protein ACKE5M_05300 [Methylophilaceae bacterium]